MLFYFALKCVTIKLTNMSREIWKQIIETVCKNVFDETDNVIDKLDSLYTVSKKGESIEVRQKKFAESLAPFKEKYPREMLKDFYDYWRETTPSGKKMLFELKKTWSIELRLARWHKNSKANEKLPNKIGRTTEDAIKKFITDNRI